MNNKPLVLLLIIILSPVIGGIYGILHDQLTYTISPEYFTTFKFEQFHFSHLLHEPSPPPIRLLVAAVGFGATWWMGLPIGFILGLVGLIHKDGKTMFKVTMRAFLVTMGVAFITGLIGLAYGHFYLAHIPKEDFSWYFPDNLVDYKSFVRVGSMHNFSYLGGLTGLIAGIWYSLRARKKETIALKN